METMEEWSGRPCSQLAQPTFITELRTIFPGMVPSIMGYGLPHQSLNKMSYRLVYSLLLWGILSIQALS